MNTIIRNEMNRRDFLKAVGLAAGAAGISVLLPGCAPAASSTTAATNLVEGMVDTSAYKKPSPWNIGRSGMGDLNAWQVSATLHFRYGVEAKYKDLFKNEWNVGANFDPAKQVSDMEDLISKKPDILIVTPVSGGNCVAQIENAMGQGIPVILVGARAYTTEFIQYLDRDNESVGKMCTDYIASQIGKTGNVCVMMGAAGNTYAEDVLRGVTEGLTLYPNMKQAALVYGNWSPTDGKTAMAAVLAKGVKIDGIINDGGMMAAGIVDAYKDAKLPVPPLCGDSDNGWLRIAKENNVKFFATYPNGNEQFLDAVDTAVMVLQGKPVVKTAIPANKTFTEADVDKLYRPDLNDQYWALGKLPEDWLQKYYKKTT